MAFKWRTRLDVFDWKRQGRKSQKHENIRGKILVPSKSGREESPDTVVVGSQEPVTKTPQPLHGGLGVAPRCPFGRSG